MTTFTARTPTDLLAIVPVVIGFHPEDSAVLLTFGSEEPRKGRAVAGSDAVQARVDLPVVEAEQRAVAEMLRDVVARHRVRVAALVLYSEDAEVSASFADLLVPGLLADGVDVIDVLRVDGERFFCVADPADVGVPYDLQTNPMTLAGVLDGRVVLESREALRDTLVGTDPAETQQVADAADVFLDSLADVALPADPVTSLAPHARWVQRTLARRLEHPDRLTATEAGRLLVLLSLDPVREVAWSAITRANATAYADFLRALIRRTPAELEAGVGSLLGLAGWLSGDGALAWCALDRSLAASPDDRLSHHVAALLETATPPSVWAPLPAGGLPIFAAARGHRPGSAAGSALGSAHGAGRRRTGVQPG